MREIVVVVVVRHTIIIPKRARDSAEALTSERGTPNTNTRASTLRTRERGHAIEGLHSEGLEQRMEQS